MRSLPATTATRARSRSRSPGTATAERKDVDDTSTGESSQTTEIASDQPTTSTSGLSTTRAWPISMQKKDQPEKTYQYRITHFTNKPMTSKKSKEIDHQLVNVIASDYMPFTFVENREVKKLINMLNPAYTLPSRKTLSKTLLTQVYNNLTEKVKEELRSATAISVTTDGWTSLSNDSYLALTVHFIDNNCKLKSFLLDCFQYNEKHTGQHLANEIKRVLQEWEILNKVVAVVTDNAANISAAIRLGGWTHQTCFAHTINLVVQAALKEIKDIHAKSKSIVEHFKRSPQAASKLKAIEKQMGFPELSVKQDMPVRWNSTFEMFDRLLKIREPLMSTLAILSYDKHHLTVEDWNVISCACRILKPFYEVTVDISAEKNVTISKIIYLCHVLSKNCEKFQK